jgi:heme/copper-type cytochrome/quinol oxidase subunit 1
LPIPAYLAEGPPGASYICKQDWNKISSIAVFVGVAAVNLPTAIGGRRCSPDRRSRVDRLELILASTLVRSEMKTLLLTATALAVVCTVGLSPAMANRFGPFDTRLTDDSDALGQNGLSAATTTTDGRHYEWQYHYGHEWEGHWVPVK